MQMELRVKDVVNRFGSLGRAAWKEGEKTLQDAPKRAIPAMWGRIQQVAATRPRMALVPGGDKHRPF